MRITDHAISRMKERSDIDFKNQDDTEIGSKIMSLIKHNLGQEPEKSGKIIVTLGFDNLQAVIDHGVIVTIQTKGE